ncbi:MAG TPA: serine protein kinase [Myxococcales bacterium]|nr:serine protein kinase [Myxococcales bacterium]HIN85986.1 serine protein kinase [Myxococcales bacterium]
MASLTDRIGKLHNVEVFQELNWTGSFDDYLDHIKKNPDICRTSFQRIYDMVMAAGFTEYEDNKKVVVHYNFFDDEPNNGKDAIFGLDIPIMKLVHVLKAAAHGFGPEKRVILLHGPVGSAKSTIARLLKKGLESYTRTAEGALYTYEWHYDGQVVPSPMHEDPIKLIPIAWRRQAVADLNPGKSKWPVNLEGQLNPHCRFVFNDLMKRYDGDWSKIMNDHIKIKRLVFSEQDRVGIGTFQPKDEKNQDSTELTGDINYRKIAEYGSDSDPRCFNFDGEFCVANRGIIEFVEILKLDVAFLYDLLGATQEHRIKPKKFAQTDIDEVIIGHTNEAEYRKLLNNEFMEAMRDRTLKIDIPYITKLSQEVRIYKKDFEKEKVAGIHVAPHTLEVAAMWAVLTRLEDPKKHNLTRMQKLKLYDGKTLSGYTQDNIKELRKEAISEGLNGISPRYIQDKISNALVAEKAGSNYINPFIVMNELESGLKTHSLITNEDDRKTYREMLAHVRDEYADIVKNEVQRAISADEDAVQRLCANYIDNVKAYTQKEKVRNPYTGRDEEPDERLLRSIEEKIDIPENRKEDFRREIMNYIGALAIDGKQFDFRTNERLHKALELKLFEDQKDTIKLTTLVSNVVDRETQEKIDVVKNRLIKNYGYNEESATDVLNFVASIFARGDAKSSG